MKHQDEPLTALFADIRAADTAARGLIALGLDEKQVQIIDLTSLLAEFDPGLMRQIMTDRDMQHLQDAQILLVNELGNRIADAIGLSGYLARRGVPERETIYYADKVRSGLVLLLAKPGPSYCAQAKQLLEEMRIQQS